MTKKSMQLQSANSFFHAYNRGVDRQQIFFARGDCELFIALMQRFMKPRELVLLAYALMPNHFHLLIQQLTPYAISRFMKGVCENYVRRLNKGRKRVGHLFQDNYTPKWVDSQSYLLYLSRYIHLNPVSAGLVKQPEMWEYSSCGLYKRGAETSLVHPGLVLEMAGGVSRYWDYLTSEKVECEGETENYLIDSELL